MRFSSAMAGSSSTETKFSSSFCSVRRSDWMSSEDGRIFTTANLMQDSVVASCVVLMSKSILSAAGNRIDRHTSFQVYARTQFSLGGLIKGAPIF